MDPIGLPDTGELTCPRCGTALDGLEEETTVAVGPEQQRLRIHVHCPNADCMAPLDVVLDAADAADAPDDADAAVAATFGGALYVEDGHRTVGRER